MLDMTRLDDHVLVALAKALHEARFCDEPNDPVVWSSPTVVDIHAAALAEQRRRDAKRGQDQLWDRWLIWTGRAEARVVVARLRQDSRLLSLVSQDPDQLRAMLRPFVVSDDELAAMIEAAAAP